MAQPKQWMRKKVYDLLFGDDAAGPPARVETVEEPDPDADAAPATESAQARDELADIETRLSNFFASVDAGNRSISAGRLQVVDLAGLRQHLGGRWEKGGELVHQMASSVIRRHLGRADVMSRNKDDSYIVLFAELGQEEAQLKAKVIADEIEQRLLGASNGEHVIKVKSVVAHVDGSVALKELDGEALIERLISEAEKQFEKQSRMLEAGLDVDDDEPLADRYEARFSPIWYVPKQVVSAHMCDVVTRDGADALARIPDPATREGLDHFALRYGVDRLAEQLAAGKVEVMMLPVHYATVMDDYGLRRYLELMAKVPEKCRPLICHHVLHVPNELPPARFNSVMATLKQFSRAIICQVELGFAATRMIDPPAVHAIGIHARNYAGKEARLMARLESFAADVERRGFRACVYGLRTRSQVMGALAAGFTYIHGAPIRADQGGLAAFGLADLYSAS